MPDMETVLIVTLAYIVGIVSVMIFNRFKRVDVPEIAEYGRRMREYEDMLVDLRIRLDTLEIRSGERTHDASQTVSQQGSDAGHKPMTIRRTLEQENGSMVDYVLKLLMEGPKTSRQIEGLIGRSMEHTARLMKKLFEMGYVTRDMATRPYVYTITDSGRTALQQVSVSA